MKKRDKFRNDGQETRGGRRKEKDERKGEVRDERTARLNNERTPKNREIRFGDERSSPANKGKFPNDRLPSVAARSSSLIFGVLPVLESLRANARRIEKIFVAEGSREKRLSEIFELARENSVLVNKVTRENLAKMVAPDANHQGVIALAAAADYVSADEILDEISENALLIVLDGVEDPRNLGAILRVVEGAGADGVFIPERRAVGLTESVAKSSAGAVEYVKVAKTSNINRLLEELKERNIWTIGTSAEADKDYDDWDWTQPSALVLGSEGKGLHRLVAENCDVLVKIPMYGRVESLNVSVAAGVILYEAKRQREKSGK